MVRRYRDSRLVQNEVLLAQIFDKTIFCTIFESLIIETTKNLFNIDILQENDNLGVSREVL